ncbi:Uncharacterised protein [Escherichia coli]|uniref:Uncharacterized protein n=1 Tax=Escherichia coli TaxID=562 RepID=A0A377BDN8_ECOLX|nr:Uncharacterised protein [Escherichia coli]
MSTSTIEALASAWARIAEEAEFPADYEGTATPQAHRASEAIQEQIRERIVATNDMRRSACCTCWVRRRCAWSKRCGRRITSG